MYDEDKENITTITIESKSAIFSKEPSSLAYFVVIFQILLFSKCDSY